MLHFIDGKWYRNLRNNENVGGGSNEGKEGIKDKTVDT